jgi:hypothetical protein
MIAAGVAAEAEVPEPTFQQVFRAEPGDRFVIGADEGKGQAADRSAQVDDGQPRTAHRPGECLIVDARENSVAAPVGQPRRRRVAQPLRLKIGRPLGAFPMVPGNAPEQAPAMGVGGFDQDGHVSHDRHDPRPSCFLPRVSAKSVKVLAECAKGDARDSPGQTVC